MGIFQDLTIFTALIVGVVIGAGLSHIMSLVLEMLKRLVYREMTLCDKCAAEVRRGM